MAQSQHFICYSTPLVMLHVPSTVLNLLLWGKDGALPRKLWCLQLEGRDHSQVNKSTGGISAKKHSVGMRRMRSVRRGTVDSISVGWSGALVCKKCCAKAPMILVTLLLSCAPLPQVGRLGEEGNSPRMLVISWVHSTCGNLLSQTQSTTHLHLLCVSHT